MHTAELHSLLCALRFRVPGRWHLLVFDRSSLFQVMHSALRGTLHQLLHSSCCTLVLLLRRVLKQLEQAWDGPCPLPAWKLHQNQQHFPTHWHTFAPASGKLKCHSRIAFEAIGLVGLDIKSHQSGSPLPFPNLVQGNVVQDQGCDAARLSTSPADVRMPSGGPFAWFSDQGYMATSPIREHVRHKLRSSCLHDWCSRPVQGLLPRLAHEVHQPTLDPALYTQCHFSGRWERWMLPSDPLPLDLSAMAYRCHRAIGGSWTERLHAHADVAALAATWATQAGWPSPRTCPLCRSGPGTPRHVIMSCKALAPVADMLRDDIEAELQTLATADSLHQAAQAWQHQARADALPIQCAAQDALRWPILSAWRWLVFLPGREPLLSVDVDGRCVTGAGRERGSDLAYRAVLPIKLGNALCAAASMEQSPALEHFATLRQPHALQQEIRALSKARAPHAPCLLWVSGVYDKLQARLDAWIHLCRIAIPPVLGGRRPSCSAPASAGCGLLTPHLVGYTARALLTELRWALLRPPAALARLRAMGPCGRLADSALLAALAQHGTAVLQDSAPAWSDPQLPTWHDAVAGLAQPCVCPQANAQRLFCCWTCGGAAWPPAGRNPSPCPFCKASVGVPCASCNCILHSRTQCRWNYDAHPAYLCPDCWLMWARSLQACPLRRRPPPLVDDLLQHLRLVADSCQAGAGSQATLSSVLRLKHVRRWLLAHIRQCSGADFDSLQHDLAARCPADTPDGTLQRLLLLASQTLRRASPPCNKTSLCRSRCKKIVPRLCTACFFLASGRSRIPSFFFQSLKSCSRSLSRLSPPPFAHFTSPPPPLLAQTPLSGLKL